MGDTPESFTEWGVRWHIDDFRSFQPVGSEQSARQMVTSVDPAYEPVVVCRTVTRTEWREVEDVPVYGVDYQGLCPAAPGPCAMCARPGRPCGEWEGVDGDRFCPRCGWAHRYHSEAPDA